MKKIIKVFLGIIAIFIFISCNVASKSAAPTISKLDIAKEKSEISQILDNLANATESGNLEMLENIWLTTKDVLLIGTESDEKLYGWKEIKEAIIKQSNSFAETLISITDQDIWISNDGHVAWFFEELNYNFVYEEKAMTFTGIRFTGVMQKIDGNWRLVQQHLSIPAQPVMVETK